MFKDKIQASFFSGLQALSFFENKEEQSHQSARIYSEFLLKAYFSESMFYLGKLQMNWSLERHLASSHNLNYALTKNSQVGLGFDYVQEQNLDESKAKIFFDIYLW